MADQPDQPVSNPQVPPPPAPSAPPRPKIKQADQYAQRWLARALTLPPPILAECLRRLGAAEPARSVARWLLLIPDRGKLSNVTSLGSLCRYVDLLRDRVKENQQKQAKTRKSAEIVAQRALRSLARKQVREINNVIAFDRSQREAQQAEPAAVAPPAKPPTEMAPYQDWQQSFVDALMAANEHASETRVQQGLVRSRRPCLVAGA